jgi:hypothetical protein
MGDPNMAALASTVTKYLGDLSAVLRHCAEVIERQTTAPCVTEDPGMADMLRRTHAVLAIQLGSLDLRLKELDGRATLKEAVTTITGFLAGLYDKMRSETLSRMLRDDFAALHFAYACQTMMIATAEACGDHATAQLVSQQQQQLPDLIRKFGDLIPVAVVSDLRKDSVPIVNPNAADTAIDSTRSAWSGMSHRGAPA